MHRAPSLSRALDSGRRTWLRQAGASVAASMLGSGAFAQDDTVRIVVPFPAGNPIDAGARVLAECLRATTRRNHIVDNKPGAGGIIGSAEVARAKPDGSVLLFTTGGHNTTAVLYSKLPYDVLRDFTPITQLATSPGFALLVRSESRFKTVADVLREAKAKPGTVSYGSFGPGNTTHLVGALFARSAGVDLLHVPFKSSPLQDLMGGHIDLTWFNTSGAQEFIDHGKMRALAISWPSRVPELPNVPTLAELGVKDVDIPAWTGLYGPPRMPAALVQSLYANVVAASRQPEYTTWAKGSRVIVTNVPPQQFASENADELRRYRRDITPLGIKLD
ncbi:Argininosuccinate lyase [Variovorax sp. PBS-H4]|uniref:Bug family tripartite tricarboxylate transporter substrate binding protein n=1 Tax=Variovorax sp. PBS-H4 TaxID=434008 RepID=UPI001315B00D|nr:tripartite tricarboxylate transporter substrate binding protein [Variovorax sp. PBS-H4]VTU28376.1 Argininosuccinate lyase [Variovorax sp. PBS-H4]